MFGGTNLYDTGGGPWASDELGANWVKTETDGKADMIDSHPSRNPCNESF